MVGNKPPPPSPACARGRGEGNVTAEQDGGPKVRGLLAVSSCRKERGGHEAKIRRTTRNDPQMPAAGFDGGDGGWRTTAATPTAAEGRRRQRGALVAGGDWSQTAGTECGHGRNGG